MKLLFEYRVEHRYEDLLGPILPKDTLESYGRTLEIKPDFHPAWNNRGYVLRSLERYEDALESAERALILNNTNPLFSKAILMRST